MARLLYGATSGDYTMTGGGRVIPNAPVEIWDAIEDGNQITDLTDYDGNPCTVVTSGADGLVRFYGPDGENDNLWMDTRQGSRLLVRPTVLTASIGDGSILDEDIAADADIDRSKIAGTGLTSESTGVCNVLDYGAVGDGVADDTDALEAAAAVAVASNLTLFLASGKTLRLTSQVDLRGNYELDIRGKLLVDHTSDAGVIVGHSSIHTVNRKLSLYNVTHSTPSTSVPALRIQGLKNATVHVGTSDYVQVFADGAESASTSVAYCTFTFGGWITKLHLFGQNGTAYINENSFFGGRITTLHVEGSYEHNNNIFHHPRIEGASASITFDNGWSNYLYGVRAEGSPGLTFGSSTVANVVTQSWTSNPASRMGPSFVIDDDGFGNLVQTITTERMQHVTLLSLAPGACPPVTSLQGSAEGSPTYATFTDTGSAITASAWRRVIDTGLIPVRRVAGSWLLDYLSVQAFQITTDQAWMRVSVVGYDSSGTRVNTEWQFNGSSATWDGTNYLWNLGSSNKNAVYIQPEDPDVHYVRILINTGSVSASFTRFGLEAMVHVGSMVTDLEEVAARMRAPLEVTGSRDSNAALASLLTQLATLGLITDSSS